MMHSFKAKRNSKQEGVSPCTTGPTLAIEGSSQNVLHGGVCSMG